jgi:D-lactate dehydrogenase (cytochrome)
LSRSWPRTQRREWEKFFTFQSLPENVFRNEPEVIQRFLGDESNIFKVPEKPVIGVYYPETEKDIVDIVLEANASHMPVTISGAGTGITGGRVPLFGGLVLSLERLGTPACSMSVSGTALCSPGIALSEMDAALPEGLFYPPDPTERSASLGGTVASNASGARCFHYGATRRWVRGLRLVLGNGDLVSIRRGDNIADSSGTLNFSSNSGREYVLNIPNYRMPPVKNAAGLYSEPGMDLIDLFIGSEGILGVFTEVEVALEKIEPIVSDMVFFKDEGDAFDYADVLRPMKSGGILAIEFFDCHSLSFMAEQVDGIPTGMGAAVFLEALGSEFGLLEKLAILQERHGAAEDWFAPTSADQRDLRELRHSLPESVNTYLKEHDSYKLGTDFVVPKGRFREMVDAYTKVGQRFERAFSREGVHHVLFGHLGDCHLHFNFITQNEDELRLAKQLYVDLALKAVALGGTISGEHGVGKKTASIGGREVPYLELMYGRGGLEEIARVKRALDPKRILNVGNVVPMDLIR